MGGENMVGIRSISTILFEYFEDSSTDFDELLRHVMSLYDVDDCDELNEYVEHLDNQRW
jgi:hypothetical protein